MASLPAETALTERSLNAATLLSTVGAGVAGIGLGIFVAGFLRSVAIPILVIGLAAHLVGMAGRRRIQSAQLYRPAAWEQWAYWGCWAAIAGLALIVAFRADR